MFAEPLGAPVVLPPLENASPVVEFTEPLPPTYVFSAPPESPVNVTLRLIEPLPSVDFASNDFVSVDVNLIFSLSVEVNFIFSLSVDFKLIFVLFAVLLYALN